MKTFGAWSAGNSSDSSDYTSHRQTFLEGIMKACWGRTKLFGHIQYSMFIVLKQMNPFQAKVEWLPWCRGVLSTLEHPNVRMLPYQSSNIRILLFRSSSNGRNYQSNTKLLAGLYERKMLCPWLHLIDQKQKSSSGGLCNIQHLCIKSIVSRLLCVRAKCTTRLCGRALFGSGESLDFLSSQLNLSNQ